MAHEIIVGNIDYGNPFNEPESLIAKDYKTIQDTLTWDSLPLTDNNPADCVTMYTTLDQALLPSECALEAIVETLPSGVAMKAVSVPTVCVCAFIDLCKEHGCAVFTQAQWTDLHK